MRPGTSRRIPSPPPRLHTIPVDTLLAFLGLLGVFFVFLYLPIGLVAVAAQDGLNENMRRGLGSEAPLPNRMIQALSAQWALIVAAAAALALAHAASRRGRRPETAFGDDLVWDGLRSPLLLLLAAAAVGAGGLTWYKGGWTENAALLAGLTLVVTAMASLAVGLLARSAGLRWMAATLLVLAVASRFGADAWGRARLAAYDAETLREKAAERTRREVAERPHLRGAPIDEDAGVRYGRIFETVRSRQLKVDVSALAARLRESRALDPLPAGAQPFLDASRGDILAVREAVRCRICLYGLDVDAESLSRRPTIDAVGKLALAIALEGREAALRGDLRGAAERYLDLVRFGGDLGDGPMLNSLLGHSAQETGLRALGRLVLSGRLDRSLLDQVEAERGRLEPARVSLASALRYHRFLFAGLDRTLSRSPVDAGLSEPLPLPWVVPYRALAAHALDAAIPVFRQCEAAIAADDSEGSRIADAAATDVGASSLNPMLRVLMGYIAPLGSDGFLGSRLFQQSREGLAWFRLVQSAIVVERQRLASRHLPSDERALDLPADPFAPGARLRYAVAGNAYKLWSVGIDGKDDGGIAAKATDLVLAGS